MMQKNWYKQQVLLWQHVLLVIFLLLIYHFIQPKNPTLGMVNIEAISQDFLRSLTVRNLTEDEQSAQIEKFVQVLEEEIHHLSEEIILFDARQVVTPLPDHTQLLEEKLLDKMLVGL